MHVATPFFTCLFEKNNRIFTDQNKPKLNERKEKIRQGYADGSHSEIEVSTYDKWNAVTILERGITLLEFKEKRWDIKFENEAAMADLLFLEFMFAEEEVEEVGEE